ncbi:butyrophilin subfamily 3 member A2-like [Tachyglossus aculeatus]|uniref:butyrophilin subfamily 3 member A2-like n=1 Tax=Tachyglossus aculeatus TaxID=9261 RepID=UPI0018F41761|nr:butyrophilin subfamily 3 member A2-like [Tachyglossus aculeatus]
MAVSPSSLVLWALPLLILFQMSSRSSAHFTVKGPDEPMVVMVGEDVELPCHLDPQMKAEHMEVRWFRNIISNVVHLYRDGKDLDEDQMPQYWGRTELLTDDINVGRVVLRLYKVRISDDGEFRCYFHDGGFYEEAVILLRVTAVGSQPQIRMAGQEGGGIRLVCSSSGWFPKPRLRWTDPRGQERPLMTESQSQDGAGLFRTEGSLVVADSSTSAVSCSVRDPIFGREKATEVSIAESFFPRVSPVLVALAVILPLLVLLLIGTACVIWAQRREKAKLKRMNVELESTCSTLNKENNILRSSYKKLERNLGTLRTENNALIRNNSALIWKNRDATRDPDKTYPRMNGAKGSRIMDDRSPGEDNRN